MSRVRKPVRNSGTQCLFYQSGQVTPSLVSHLGGLSQQDIIDLDHRLHSVNLATSKVGGQRLLHLDQVYSYLE